MAGPDAERRVSVSDFPVDELAELRDHVDARYRPFPGEAGFPVGGQPRCGERGQPHKLKACELKSNKLKKLGAAAAAASLFSQSSGCTMRSGSGTQGSRPQETLWRLPATFAVSERCREEALSVRSAVSSAADRHGREVRAQGVCNRTCSKGPRLAVLCTAIRLKQGAFQVNCRGMSCRIEHRRDGRCPLQREIWKSPHCCRCIRTCIHCYCIHVCAMRLLVHG